MARKKYVVRMAIPTIENQPPLAQLVDGTFLECLRYAGIVTVHRHNEEGQVFDIHAPVGVDSATWAEMNASRMQSFGYNAVSTPSTAPVEPPTINSILRGKIESYVQSRINDSWKGGGDPSEIPMIEEELRQAQSDLDDYIRNNVLR